MISTRSLTVAGLLVFGASLAVVLLGARATDRVLDLSPLPAGIVWRGLGWGLLVLGLLLAGWCAGLFVRREGTPVPANPPGSLVLQGPYARVRNPMLTGVFAALFGAGILLRSPSAVFLWTPAYVVLHVLELKWVEEPDLEERFGEAYRAYRAAVPMFMPRLWRRR